MHIYIYIYNGCGDKFIHMVENAFTNIRSKIKINGLLPDPLTFTWGACQGCLFSMLLYIIVPEVLARFIYANKRIKGTQIGGDHEIKIVDFAEDTTILLRDIICLNRIQVILKLYEDTYSSKTKFSKIQAWWSGAYKNRIDQPGQMKWSKFPLKYLDLTLVTLFLITPSQTKKLKV